jgi:pantetheine-phosphate adenylyltransferase
MSEPRVAIYPGTFDPLTLGHEDIARRSLKFVDRLILAVIEMIEECFAKEPRVDVTEFSGLLVEFCQEVGARLVVRGLRAVSDFEYEFQMALMNRELLPELEMVFMTPAGEFTFLSASLVREIASLGGDVSRFVSPSVLRRLEQHISS